eukprot:TRINITY_DN26993_c0_g1_i2.p1 TRINITY_DN26993_c0_g1~~TRINITY_DN26993_c0_g1_i2.p1  ORF type:complete len:284 (+),score=39.20 TRINITY_DN26993_c0_g1_i2:79-852(+)
MGLASSQLEDPKQKQLRLLCLSGNASRHEITEMQVSHLQLEENFNVKLEFLNGPFEVSEPYDSQLKKVIDGPFFNWCSPEERKCLRMSSVQQGVEHLLHHVAVNGPYDGIYGFSMGALIAAAATERLLETAAAAKVADAPKKASRGWACFSPGEPPLWQFVICACGTSLESPNLPAGSVGEEGFRDESIGIRSFHLIGANDPIRHRSQRLAAVFTSPSVYEMRYAGHSIPMAALSDASLTDALSDFMRQVRDAYTVS